MLLRRIALLGVLSLTLGLLSFPAFAQVDTLDVAFDGLYGQIEVGGPFVGAEFHGSRPTPARISFYHPVANSIDLSTDYWQRGDSRPFTVRLYLGGEVERLDALPMAYSWTPYHVTFSRETDAYAAHLSYQFAETLPLMVVRMRFTNRSTRQELFKMETNLQVVLRTSHTYAVRHPARTRYSSSGRDFFADFDAPDADDAQVFVLNAGHEPETRGALPADTSALFAYAALLAPGESFEIVQLIGSENASVTAVREQVAGRWQDDVAAYEHGIRTYAASRPIVVPDSALMQTAHLARALLRANRHYLDATLAPMPAPAEYNFFFTHDLLLTDLGAVRFDVARVRDDLRYIASLVKPDSILPHARYWKDSTYVTEPTAPDNWNHLWVNVLAASYLKHSGDTATVAALYPTLAKSLRLMLRNERDGLMYAIRPDWWDIGNVYGARAYLTALTIRGLESFAYTSERLGRDTALARDYLERTHRLRYRLAEKLWDDEAGYLLNELEEGRIDSHYYSGSLLAAAFGVLDAGKTDTLLDTATRELLDEAVGIRNAMPADFHEHIDTYRFNGMEAGAPYLYMNGGIWTQGSAWYALALLEAGRPDAAREALTRYFTIDGLLQSPNGQPAFYEYRNGDSSSPRHGEIDKPTFLWAGGWYLNVLYALAGARSDAWNLFLDPQLPAGFDDVSYVLMVEGQPVRVTSHGTGDTFKSIRVAGARVHSAVLTGPVPEIALVRGRPDAPYLASATVRILNVTYESASKTLAVEVAGIPGQAFALEAVSPSALQEARPGAGATANGAPVIADQDGVSRVHLPLRLEAARAVVQLLFQ